MTTLRGMLAFLGYIINTLFWFPLVFGLGLLKLLPIAPLKRLCSWGADRCASAWITINNLNQRLLSGTRVVVHPLPELSVKEWYMVIANHQSWVDILMLQRLFIGKIPFIKFFLKAELIFVPFIGLCWWALDFPFMRRFSRQYLEKHPHMKGKDVETTRKACEKYKHSPVTIMNFVEGTRYTAAKHQRQKSPFDQLLRPKAGGLAFTLDAMGNRLDTMLDVTIYYPDGAPSFWDFMCGRVRQVEISVEARSMEALHRLGYDTPENRAAFQDWLNTLWQEKEQLLAQRSYEDKQ